MRIAIQTLGCKVNQSESASIEGLLINENYEIVNYKDNPDVCIVNTCTVTAKSDYQSRQLIRKALRTGAKVIAAGCYAQLKPDELSKIEGLNLTIGNAGKKYIIHYIKKLANNSSGSNVTGSYPLSSPLILQPYYSNRARAFLKIQDGCNLSCSYCTVPLARGNSRSLNLQDVIKAVEQLHCAGYKEIVLTGIHIGSYGLDLVPKSTLLNIVDMLIKSFPHIRFRLSSIEPQEFKNDFLRYIKDGSVCSHLHIPLQSGSDRILKVMKRGYNTSSYIKVIDNIVAACPDIAIGTDVIAGFPGESERDFEETVKLVDQIPLSYLHVFPYSKRPDTVASLYDNHINEKIKHDRVKILLEIAKKKNNIYLNKNLGKTLDVIVENNTAIKGLYKGISDNYLKLTIKSDNLSKGHRLKVLVISLTASGLIAEPLK
ncbi:MAG: tRNA (N(6)-L-threonylcarbamoyladenosine(37)-C(2))-methylthiotransferase MtaB [Nitrospirae bacterium]|nr:tRNA (N(6)-L-threonylcarbamoyladenosine(37)-C(2))-methylthiotransferase MtaB [Nitrospirota bacterium]